MKSEIPTQRPFKASRPKLKPSMTELDWAIEIFAWTLFAVLIITTLSKMNGVIALAGPQLTDQSSPEIELSLGFQLSSQVRLWLSPLICGLIFFFLSVASQFPWRHSFPIEINSDNCEKLYQLSNRLLSISKIWIGSLFLWTQYGVIQVLLFSFFPYSLNYILFHLVGMMVTLGAFLRLVHRLVRGQTSSVTTTKT